MAKYPKQTKTLKLDLDNVDRSLHREVKNRVGTYLRDAILSDLAEGRSPVQGQRFSLLTKEYANDEKGGNRTPNLRLEGDLLDALDFKNRLEGLEIGIFKASENGKADGHNNFSGKSTQQRRFIPDKEEIFRPSIMRRVNDIIKEYESRPESRDREERPIASRRRGQETTETVGESVLLSDLFPEEDFLGGFFGES